MDKNYQKELQGRSTVYNTVPEYLKLAGQDMPVPHEDEPTPPPIIDGYEYVDLGLPSGKLWAAMNVGATSYTDAGKKYKFGAQGDEDGDYYNMTSPPNVLPLEYDDAHCVMGGRWRMATKDEWEELRTNTSFEWVQSDEFTGGKLTSSNGNSILFPVTNPEYNLVYHNTSDVSGQGDTEQCYVYGMVPDEFSGEDNIRNSKLAVRAILDPSEN